LIAGLKGKIWIVGGSEIINQVRSCGLIDEYILQIAPVILGDGIPLFSGYIPEELKLKEIKRYGDMLGGLKTVICVFGTGMISVMPVPLLSVHPRG